MEIEIKERKENPSLRREEITFQIIHDAAATPSRETVASKLAAIVNAERKLTVLRTIDSEFGRNQSRGFATVYEDEDARAIEQTYILKRNGLVEEEE